MNSNHCMNIHANKKIVSRGVLHADALGYKITIFYKIPYIVYTAISIKVVPRAKRKSRIRARKAAGNR